MQELSIRGCSNLEQLDLSVLTLLSKLSLEGCARLAIRDLSSQANLHSLSLRHCRQRLQPLLGDLAGLVQLRVLVLQVACLCQISTSVTASGRPSLCNKAFFSGHVACRAVKSTMQASLVSCA